MRAVDRLRGPWGLVALLLTLLAVGGSIYMLVRADRTPAAASSVPVDVSRELGAPPPRNVARDPRAAEAYVREQTCLADCQATARICAATAVDDEDGRARCVAEGQRCGRGCR